MGFFVESGYSFEVARADKQHPSGFVQWRTKEASGETPVFSWGTLFVDSDLLLTNFDRQKFADQILQAFTQIVGAHYWTMAEVEYELVRYFNLPWEGLKISEAYWMLVLAAKRHADKPGVNEILQRKANRILSYKKNELPLSPEEWRNFLGDKKISGEGISPYEAVFDGAQSQLPQEHKANVVDGGIDLNAKKMDLDVAKDGKGVAMNFDPAMVAEFRKGNFTGVEGIILKIVPIANPLLLLGLESSPTGSQLAKG